MDASNLMEDSPTIKTMQFMMIVNSGETDKLSLWVHVLVSPFDNFSSTETGIFFMRYTHAKGFTF